MENPPAKSPQVENVETSKANFEETHTQPYITIVVVVVMLCFPKFFFTKNCSISKAKTKQIDYLSP